MAVETTGEVPNYGTEAAYRAICHFLLSLIPAAGLPEVYEALRDAYQYHVMAGPQASRPRELPARTVIGARVTRSYERPEFGIAEG